jgi:hypothetical protein
VLARRVRRAPGRRLIVDFGRCTSRSRRSSTYAISATLMCDKASLAPRFHGKLPVATTAV